MLSTLKQTVPQVKRLRGHLRDRWEYHWEGRRSQVCVFVHIPKCGGTTFSNLVRLNYSRLRTFSYLVAPRSQPLSFANSTPDIVQIRDSLRGHQHQINCVLGHIPYGIHRYIDRECVYVALMRDPVARTLSQFNHALNMSRQISPLHAILKQHNYDLAKVLRSDAAFHFANDQCRMLLGTDKLKLEKADLVQAIAHINTNYFHVGCVEQLDATVRIVSKALGWHAREHHPGQCGSLSISDP